MPAVGQTVAHVPAHAVAAVEPTLIGLAWNVPDAQAVQAMSAVVLPSAETKVPAGQVADHGVQPPPEPLVSQPLAL